MKILDVYILKNFIQNFLFGLLSFLALFILVDVFENLDRFVDADLNLLKISEYYLFFIPEILKLITPVGMLLASLFTIGRFINFSEITAMQSSGMSLYRYTLPIFIFACFIALFSIYFNGWIVPESNKSKFEFERNYLGKNIISYSFTNLYYQEGADKLVSIQLYSDLDKSASNVMINLFSKDNLNQMISRYDIENMKWNSEKNSWDLNRVHVRHFPADSIETIQYAFIENINIDEIKEISGITTSPDLIRKKQLKPDEMNLTEHKEFIDNLKFTGLDAARTEVDYYSRISFSFACVVTVLFGVSLSNSRRKGGAAMQFGIAILISFIYLGFVKISQVFGYNGDLNPVFTAWLANIIFLLISILNFYKIQKT